MDNPQELSLMTMFLEVRNKKVLFQAIQMRSIMKKLIRNGIFFGKSDQGQTAVILSRATGTQGSTFYLTRNYLEC